SNVGGMNYQAVVFVSRWRRVNIILPLEAFVLWVSKNCSHERPFNFWCLRLGREKGGEREHRLLLWVRKMLRRESTFLGESRLCAIVLYRGAGIVPDMRGYAPREKSGVFRLCKK